jgi:hypothetical protein
MSAQKYAARPWPMLRVRRAAAAPLNDQQQHLVATVRESMESFHQHRARPRE